MGCLTTPEFRNGLQHLVEVPLDDPFVAHAAHETQPVRLVLLDGGGQHLLHVGEGFAVGRQVAGAQLLPEDFAGIRGDSLGVVSSAGDVVPGDLDRLGDVGVKAVEGGAGFGVFVVGCGGRRLRRLSSCSFRIPGSLYPGEGCLDDVGC